MTILTIFGAANQQKWLKSKNSFWNLFRVPIVIENEGRHQDLKIVPFFHLIPPTPRYIHNTFSKCLKHEKQFLFILIYFCWTLLYLRLPTLINTWNLCWTLTNYLEPPLCTYFALKTMERGFPCNYWVWEEEMKQIFWCDMQGWLFVVVFR